MKRHTRASLIALAAFSLMGSPLAAQSAQEVSPPADVKRDGAQATQILATDAASRVGIARAEGTAEGKAAMQAEGTTTRWIVIVVVGILLAAIILAIAN